ncbi:hypothetical protein GPX89_35675 [Nocardia sp. ET3-3]|uniref:Uncharacterized protein n=1 Tax=Nocardia terrae TaxID=2675851 RepID=A0A7K1V8X8_9NOCA|nr:hypothetical protein [Nocardia terrae]MVU82558.1 hypothetical protein [Nocardia terrae]
MAVQWEHLSGRGERWHEVATAAAELLGSEWMVIGRRGTTRIVHTPVKWVLERYGYETTSSAGRMHLFAGVFLHHVAPIGDVGTTQQTFRIREPRRPYPRLLDVFDEHAPELVRDWIADVHHVKLFESPRYFEQRLEQVTAPGNRWERGFDLLPGLTCVTGIGDMLAAVSQARTAHEKWPTLFSAEQRNFLSEFEVDAIQGGRSSVLEFMDRRRRIQLTDEFKIPDRHIEGVLWLPATPRHCPGGWVALAAVDRAGCGRIVRWPEVRVVDLTRVAHAGIGDQLPESGDRSDTHDQAHQNREVGK